VGAGAVLPVERGVFVAAQNGSLEVLKWAREPQVCANAAEGGHLEVLQWAREHDCPWDEDTCAAAADIREFVGEVSAFWGWRCLNYLQESVTST
jgi:hypothetical protein